jgi:hypothetical protein
VSAQGIDPDPAKSLGDSFDADPNDTSLSLAATDSKGRWTFTLCVHEERTIERGDLTLHFPRGCVSSNVSCSVRRIGISDELADWGDTFVRQRLTSSADACSDIWVLEPHGLTFEPRALPTLSLRLGTTSNTQTFVRIESTYPLPLSSHWKAVPGGDFEDGMGKISLTGFSCFAVACCEVDCFISTQRVSAQDTDARVFFGAVPSTKGDLAKLSGAHARLRSSLASVSDDYECHQFLSTVMLADKVSYKLQFDEARKALSFKWNHLADGEALFGNQLLLCLNPKMTFGDLSGFPSGQLKLSARLTRASPCALRPCHAALLASEQSGTDATRLPRRLEDWTGDHLKVFLSAYPNAGSYNQDALHATGGVLHLRATGSMLIEENDLVAYLRRESEALTELDAQMVVKDLSHFVDREYDVRIEFRTIAAALPSVPAQQPKPEVQPPAAQPRKISFDVQDAEGTSVKLIEGRFASFAELKSSVEALKFFDPAIDYEHAKRWVALRNDAELQQACEAAVSDHGAPDPFRVRLRVTARNLGEPSDAVPKDQCEWAAFISHHQAVASHSVLWLGSEIERRLEREGKRLTKVWIDKKERATEEGMRQGVRRSCNFVLLMTKDVLARDWCVKETRDALKYRKNVILVFQTDERIGGVRGSFSDYYGPELKKAFPHPDDYAWLTRNSYVQCHDRGQHIDVMFRDEKCKNGILDQMDLEDSTVSPLSASSHISGPCRWLCSRTPPSLYFAGLHSTRAWRFRQACRGTGPGARSYGTRSAGERLGGQQPAVSQAERASGSRCASRPRLA